MKLPRNSFNGWIVASIMPPIDETINGKYRYQGWSPCINWCKHNFKESNWRFVGEGVFEFRRSNDYMMFLLRWA